ncbi:sensor histidine kinase [Desulfosporosinus shakirovi]|uniref:sensor histidine kinase n=1 Tax=Desulfosporosinus shakirovi TaxID=2885154 RepID=UPI001E3146E0|nr:HAMP domain-containing sensor histidine kinase [Desulfosporosinus sp. SRJS8]MCB8817534.1 HAMP domain-containing histidine kinase [Desulfosporosinus sp. SRJS8]
MIKGLKAKLHFALNSFILIACAFTVGYFIAALLFKVTGQPPELLRYIISGFIGLLFLWAAFSLKPYKEDKWIAGMFDALENMAQGNFNVQIEKDNHGFLDELTERINIIAQGLGSMETLRQNFVADVSHEIQSPLTSISGYAALLENDALTHAERMHYIQIIQVESKRLSKLSANLLKLSSLDIGVTSLSLTKFRLDKQLQNISILLEPQWSKKNLLLEAELDKVTIYADEELLSQMWINLMHNAIKFTTEGGTIHIALTRDTEKISCTMADTGVGIAPEDQLHIFERFYKVDKSRDRTIGGNGLGLSMVRKIVELHGGKVTLESEIGKGSTFTVSLPVSD